MVIFNLILRVVLFSFIFLKVYAFDSARLNQVYYGVIDCANIKEKTLPSCINRQKKIASELPFDIAQRIVFDKASEIAKNRNECFRDFSIKLLNSEKALDEFKDKLITLWLNRKKALLYLEQCDLIEIAFTSLPKTVTTRINSELNDRGESEYLNKNFPKIDQNLINLCRRKHQVSALKKMVDITENSVPFFSSPEIIEIIDSESASLIHDGSDRPITNLEILKLPTKEFNLSFNKVGKSRVDQKIIQFFQTQYEKRKAFVEDVKGEFTNNKLKSLFQEGSAEIAMDNLGLSEKDSQSNRDIYKLRNCIKSYNEDNSMSDVFSVLGLYFLFKGTVPASANLGRAKSLLTEISLTAASSTPIIIKSCEILKEKPENIVNRNEQKASIHGLPKGFDLNFYELESLSASEIKSCSSLGTSSFKKETNSELSCLAEIAFSLSPI